ncbi:MAG: response regulator transcription factor [Pseudomonadota bacterium]
MPLFISSRDALQERWLDAFPDAPVTASLDSVVAKSLAGVGSVWLDLSAEPVEQRARAAAAAVALGTPVVVLVAAPSDAEAFSLLQVGVQGYCHLKAAPEQLEEVATVVEHGGVWMPPGLMRRLLAVSTRVVIDAKPATSQRLEGLTARELMVAKQVAVGASNREIAERLGITERTVKAHLSVIFDKLGVRDRVQLALAMNNIPTPATVN